MRRGPALAASAGQQAAPHSRVEAQGGLSEAVVQCCRPKGAAQQQDGVQRAHDAGQPVAAP